MRTANGLVGVLAIGIVGCVTLPIARPLSDTWPDDWSARVGQTMTLEGIAEESKVGAVLVTGEQIIWIDGLESWPNELTRKLVRVTGKVIRKDDLPVFVHKPDEPPRAGMAVSSETEGARRKWRYLLQVAEWERLD